MEAKELRIGNYIQAKNEPGRVQGIVLSLAKMGAYTIPFVNAEGKADTLGYNECEPIVLTEEWLEKFDFYFVDGDWHKNNVVISTVPNDVSYYYDGANGVVVDLSYVHQLQNLYYILQGEDLSLLF
jgi:hypothetical protein